MGEHAVDKGRQLNVALIQMTVKGPREAGQHQARRVIAKICNRECENTSRFVDVARGVEQSVLGERIPESLREGAWGGGED